MAPMRVFVSHSNHDSSFCQNLVQALRDAGADVWYDEHNMDHGQLMEVVQRELDNRPVFIVILSPSAFASTWVRRETLWAYDLLEDDPTRILLPITAAPIKQINFTGQSGWLFLRGFKRIEASKYQPCTPQDAIRRTLRALALTKQGENLSTIAPRPQESIKELIERGKALNIQARYKDALVLFQRASQLDPHSFDAWFQLGIALHDMKHLEEALDAYDRALTINSNSAPILESKAILLKQLAEFNEAESGEMQAQPFEDSNEIHASSQVDVDVSESNEDCESDDILLPIDMDASSIQGREEQDSATSVGEDVEEKTEEVGDTDVTVMIRVEEQDLRVSTDDETEKKEAGNIAGVFVSKEEEQTLHKPDDEKITDPPVALPSMLSDVPLTDDAGSPDPYFKVPIPPSEEETTSLPQFSKRSTGARVVVRPQPLEKKSWRLITIILSLLLISSLILFSSFINPSKKKDVVLVTQTTIPIEKTPTRSTVRPTPQPTSVPTTSAATPPPDSNVPVVPIATPPPQPNVVPTPFPTPTQHAVRTVKTQITKSTSVKATGSMPMSATWASGQLEITNDAPNSTVLSLPVGYTIPGSTSSMPTMILTQPVVNLPVSASALVSAHTQLTGSQENISAYSFSSYCTTAQFIKVKVCYEAYNSTAFTGGTDAHSDPVVLQSDIDNAVKGVGNPAPDSRPGLQSQLAANEHLIGAPSCTPQVSSNPAVNSRAVTAAVTVIFTCTEQAQS